jgi:hypothetical protein
MPKRVGHLMSTINCLQHPCALVRFLSPIYENALYNDQETNTFTSQSYSNPFVQCRSSRTKQIRTHSDHQERLVNKDVCN